jgi:hypothetical protein
MTSRYSFLTQPAERRQLAVFRSSAAAAIVAAVIGVGFLASRLPQQAASGNLGDEFGGGTVPVVAPAPAVARAPDVIAPAAAALAPVDMAAEYQAAVDRARLAAADQPSATAENAGADDAARKTLPMGEPAVF